MNIKTIRFGFIVFTLATSAAFAQQKMDGMKGMDMKGDMKGMDMKGMAMEKKSATGDKASHTTKATVKKVDAKKGTVTLAHEPVASLNWPAMTMSFKVEDRTLMKKLTNGKKVVVDFAKQGEDYVVTSVK